MSERIRRILEGLDPDTGMPVKAVNEDYDMPDDDEDVPHDDAGDRISGAHDIDELISDLQKVKAKHGSRVQVAYGSNRGVDTEGGVYARIHTVNAYGGRYTYLVFDPTDDY
tara:strand:+ start:35341 stop:35673 length:333 start_codon:yes stop_codon:yes gene_type:complete